MVWGCVSGLNLSHLVPSPPRMNDEKYGNIISDVIYPMVMIAEEAIFQEENAPIHKSKPVKELKDDLGINRDPQTEADLEEAVFSAWNTITFEKILHFIDSVPERINEGIEKKWTCNST
ncbi:10950_t:CDS:2 [Ambispora gerdemannii]|uniref:10950_t:CDS:1 n=1 Tax=Ambispora gerdemannii TaxID=144530 RepID=A0A9N9E4Z5_9GLOM|nr:10950_t:CDS:2 [Ambispora gerdemannii]